MGSISQNRRKAFVVKSNAIMNSLKANVVISCDEKSVEVIALWDTGATNSCISMDVVENLGLVVTGNIDVLTPSGGSIANTYLVDVLLPNNVPVKDLRVCDSKIGSQGIGMLVGMDIISKGDFCVSNFQGQTVFSFRMPSDAVMDFVSGIKVSNIIGKRHGRGNRKRKKK